jgi:type IV secretion system protein TrbL
VYSCLEYLLFSQVLAMSRLKLEHIVKHEQGPYAAWCRRVSLRVLGGSGTRILRIVIPAALVLAASGAVQAQGPLNSPSQILQQYRSQELAWFAAVEASATKLFTLLAAIEVAWTLTLVVLERSDFHSLVAILIRKVMWIGIFYTLLINGQNWIPWIIQSFGILGQRAAGVNGTIAPSNVLSMGLNIFGSLLSGASEAGFLRNFGVATSLVLAAFVTLLAYVIVTIQFVAAMVESYIVIGAGFIFLGFGGSRWTMPYVERYIGLAISIGIKLMTLYLLIGVGMNLSNGWLAAAAQVPNSVTPAISAGDIVAACVIFMALCWMSPKLISAVIGGSPAFTGSDLLSPAMTLAAVGMTGASWALGGGAGALSAGQAVRDWAEKRSPRSSESGSGGVAGGMGGPGASGSGAQRSAKIASGSTFSTASGMTPQPSPPKDFSSPSDVGAASGQVSPPGYTQILGEKGARALRNMGRDLKNIPLPPDTHHGGPPPGFEGIGGREE